MMKFKDVVRLLENKAELPIKPMDIARILVEGNIREEFIFVGVDIDPSILRGKIVQLETTQAGDGTFKPPYVGNSCGLISKVYYSTRQDSDMMAFVVIKELLHVIDPPTARTDTPEKLSVLLKQIILPPEVLGMSGEADPGAMVDMLAAYRAMVAMVPERHRVAILEKYNQQKLTLEEVSRLIGMPSHYTRVVLSDRWDYIRKLWLSL
jgi:hypothetical protein